MIRAAVYCRISFDPEDGRGGVEDQERDCRRFATSREWEVVGAYIDNDRSAWNGKARPEFERLIRDVTDGRIDAVIVYRLSRLGRDVREQEDTFALFRAQHVLLATSDGEVQIGNADGRFMTRIQGAVNAHESELISERVKRRMTTRAESGLPHGRRPYGYQRDCIAIAEHEATVLRGAVRRLLDGHSLRSVAMGLNAAGERTTIGNLWTHTALRRTVLNPRYTGIRRHASGDHKAVWESIIDADDYARLVAMIRDPRRCGVGAPPRKLLSGILRCGKCGTRMSATSDHNKKDGYGCPGKPRGCAGTSLVAHVVNDLISETVLTTLDQATFDTTTEDDDNADAYRARLVELAEMWAEGEISRSSHDAARRRLEQRIAESEGAHVRRVEKDALSRTRIGLRDRWEGMSIEERRSVIAAVIDHVVVGPGRSHTFDAGRLNIVWRA